MATNNKSPFLTTGERVRNYLVIAFLLSLVVHTIVAAVLRVPPPEEQPEDIHQVSIHTKIKPPPTPKPTPPPTPTPPPHPTQAPPQQPQAKLKINVVHTHNTTHVTTNVQKYVPPKQGTEIGVPSGQGTASPGPATAGPPACRVPYADATSTDQVAPDYPQDAKELGIGDVTVLVQVTVGPSGSLEAASIYQSSHNMSIDREALRAARESRYSPKIVDCSPVSGTYLFRADFTTQ